MSVAAASCSVLINCVTTMVADRAEIGNAAAQRSQKSSKPAEDAWPSRDATGERVDDLGRVILAPGAIGGLPAPGFGSAGLPPPAPRQYLGIQVSDLDADPPTADHGDHVCPGPALRVWPG